MATSLSGVLANIPGLAGYYAKDQLNREQTQQELAQFNTLSQLQAQMQNRQRQEAARQALSGLGPDATEDQRVNALLPHIGDPDKIAGILQNASLKKAQQAQTREIAAQNLSQRLATEARHAYEFAQTLPLKERQVALQEINTRLNAAYKQGMLRLSAGEAQWSRGEDVSPIMDYLNTMRGLVASPSASQGASPGQAAPTPQPAPSAAPGPVSAPSVAPGGPVPLGVRNNNPGNLRPVGSSVGFQQFSTPEEGLAALDKNLQAYANLGINTLEGVINRWAPPSENDTGAYVRAAAQRLGIDPKQPIDLRNPLQRQALATAIMLHENGPQGLFGGGQPPSAPQPAPVTPAAPNNLDARDLRLAAMPNGGAPAVPVAASPQPAPQAAPQPDTRKQLTIDDAPAGLTPRQRQEWLANEIKKQGDSKNRVLDEKAIEDERKRGLRLTLQNERANLVLKTVDETLDKIGFMNTGLIGGVTKYIPSSPAFNLDKAVDTLKANIGFQELQAMREASPTGGALGQVAVQELNMLQSVLGSLDVGQSSDQLRKNLGAVKTHYESWKRIMQQAEASRIPKVGAVVDGFRFKGGDPSKSTSWEQLK